MSPQHGFGVILMGLALLLGAPAFAETADDLQAAARFFNEAATSQNPVVARLARENLTRLEQNRPSVAHANRHRIQVFSQADDSIAVAALLNGKTMGTFIVDTGASYTVITPRMARKLGIEGTQTVSVLTGNGVIQAPLVTLKDVMIGQVHVSEVKAVIQDLGDDLMISGVLGMNFFKGKSITIQQDSLILEDSPEVQKLSSR